MSKHRTRRMIVVIAAAATAVLVAPGTSWSAPSAPPESSFDAVGAADEGQRSPMATYGRSSAPV